MEFIEDSETHTETEGVALKTRRVLGPRKKEYAHGTLEGREGRSKEADAHAMRSFYLEEEAETPQQK